MSLDVMQGNFPTSETSSEHLVTPVITPRWKVRTKIATGIVREDAVLISPTTPHSMAYLAKIIIITTFYVTGDILLSPEGGVAADLLAGRVEGTVLSLTWSYSPTPFIIWYTV